MKYIRFCLKVLPILTIVGGFITGGGQLGPIFDTAKITLTQYEVAEITKLVYGDVVASKGKIMTSKQLPGFVQEHFYNQYSVLARELYGDTSKDLSLDIWKKSFQILLREEKNQVQIASSGPDGKIGTKDDITIEFPYEFNRKKKVVVRPVEIAQPTHTEEELNQIDADREPASEEVAVAADLDEAAFNQDGFDRDGYDQDGFDVNGIHRDEKSATYQ